MKYQYNIFLILMSLFFFSRGYEQRNPFECKSEHIKKYMPLKVQNAFDDDNKEQSSEWKISEAKNGETHIVEDKEGNVRSISFSVKN